jgi:hypothetical protein
MKSKCIVHGCTNDSDSGGMSAECLCTPCYNMLKAGSPQSPGETFIHKMNTNLKRIRNRLHNMLAKENGNSK